MDVGAWLRELGLEQYEAAFRENAIHAGLLPNLTADDFKDLGVSLVGHRRQILDAIAALRPRAAATDIPAPVSTPPPSVPAESPGTAATAERRPLSVMFCDLIGSTALSARLDPEDLREVIHIYQARVASTIQQFNGFIARYVGDGVLIYFGWPEAHETDAALAIRAGLAVAAAVSETPIRNEILQVRIGIATGLVVIGEPIGASDARQQTAVGETPNRAARLQGLAGPNQVVIDAATRRQVGGLFDCRDLGTIALKGLPEPVPAWQVVAENRALGQFEALRSGLTPLVGREEEIELLLRRWAQIKAGSGKVVLISAEPGVGKSRLAEVLAERVAAEPHIRLRYFCSPHHQDSALYPVTAQMERAAGFAHADAPAVRLAKLQALLAATEPPREDVVLIAALHELSSADLVPPLDLTPQRRKEKTFQALLCQLEGLARQQPVLMVFDDLHWIDPSSRELLDRLIERVTNWPVLLLALFRPEFQPPWVGQPHVTMMTLARLDRCDTTAMVASVAGNAALPSEIVEEIADRTDGVPLFIEELTKAVLEAGSRAPAALSSVPPPRLAVPATLHASLMARLDRLGQAAREVAQGGAAIGREFGYGLLTGIMDLPEQQLLESLDRLVAAGLVFARGTPPDASYLFKHALVQDAAYGSLLRGRRQGLHRRIVATLEERLPETVQAHPALLAQHCQEAGLVEQAAVYWLTAGQQALARSAMAEAEAQLRKGLDALTTLSDGPWRQQQELDLQVTLGHALTATQGHTTVEVFEAITRIRALAEQLDRPEYLVPAIGRQYWFHTARGEPRLALALAEELEAIGKTRNQTEYKWLGRFMQGISRFRLGEFIAARAMLEQCTDLDESTRCKIRSLGWPADQYLTMLAYLAFTMACLGYLDQARSTMNEALSEAHRLQHLFTVVLTLCWASWLDLLTGSPLMDIEELQSLATEHDFPHMLANALAIRGRSLIALGQAQEGLELCRQALAKHRAIGHVAGSADLLASLAVAHASLGHPDEARNCLTEAARIIETTDERISEAYVLYQVPGDLLNAAGDQSGAEQHYRQAIAVAERQGAKLLQLRASISLTRLWRDQGRPAEARDLLAPIYGWFTEGFDAPVLKEAKALLDELA
jgi:class 3 adenylate cyclase/tetratricopeptide (TPR) repeat protein